MRLINLIHFTIFLVILIHTIRKKVKLIELAPSKTDTDAGNIDSIVSKTRKTDSDAQKHANWHFTCLMNYSSIKFTYSSRWTREL